MPNGIRMQLNRNQRGVRDPVLQISADEFQAGPIPRGITRRYFANDQGLNGDDTNYFPTTSGQEYIMHQPIPRTPRAKAGRYGVPTIDETLAVPSVGVGDAV
jgi:hypothetical protein